MDWHIPDILDRAHPPYSIRIPKHLSRCIPIHSSQRFGSSDSDHSLIRDHPRPLLAGFKLLNYQITQLPNRGSHPSIPRSKRLSYTHPNPPCLAQPLPGCGLGLAFSGSRLSRLHVLISVNQCNPWNQRQACRSYLPKQKFPG
jgi:hypothetical protein